MRYYCTW